MANLDVGVSQALTDLPTGDPALVAKRAEELGFASYWAPEHTVIPVPMTSPYPAGKPGEPPPDFLFKMPDPFIALSRAGAVTSKIKLGTGVCLIPERNPLLTAKEVASLDYYTGGRFLFGIGAGWNEEECTVMGGDFAHRWTQTREAILAMKELWIRDKSEYHGTYFDFQPVVCVPKPAQKPHPPILLGSIGSPHVFRRIVEWGDGWVPYINDPKQIADGRTELDERAKRADRDPKSIQVTAFCPEGMFRTATDIEDLRRAGADGAVLALKAKNEKDILAELEYLADKVL